MYVFTQCNFFIDCAPRVQNKKYSNFQKTDSIVFEVAIALVKWQIWQYTIVSMAEVPQTAGKNFEIYMLTKTLFSTKVIHPK